MEIIPNVYLITAPLGGVNTYLIVDTNLILIDTGFPGDWRRIVRYIRKLGKSPEDISMIVITHNHIDHTGGLKGLQRVSPAKAAVHEADNSTELLYSESLRRIINFPVISLFKPFVHHTFRDSDELLTGGEVLPVLGGLKVIHTPGHTPGSICLYSAEKKILFSGDLVNTRYDRLRTPDTYLNSSNEQLVKTILEISRLDFDILCVGHGRPILSDADSDVRLLADKLM